MVRYANLAWAGTLRLRVDMASQTSEAETIHCSIATVASLYVRGSCGEMISPPSLCPRTAPSRQIPSSRPDSNVALPEHTPQGIASVLVRFQQAGLDKSQVPRAPCGRIYWLSRCIALGITRPPSRSLARDMCDAKGRAGYTASAARRWTCGSPGLGIEALHCTAARPDRWNMTVVPASHF